MNPKLMSSIRQSYQNCVANGKVARAAQEAMTVDIAEPLFDTGVRFLESRTGTGKTLAMLLAAASYVARTGPEAKVTIATPQKNLQKDIVDTFIRDVAVLPEFSGVKIACLKGRRNYVSVRKRDILLEIMRTVIDKRRQDSELAHRLAEFERAIQAFADHIDACLGDLDLIEGSIWEGLINVGLIDEEDDIRDLLALPAEKTDDEDEEYYIGARGAVKDANIVVTNHTLLVISGNLAMLQKQDPGQQLVPTTNIIIDEGHAFIRSARNVWHKAVAVKSIIDWIHHLETATGAASYRGARAHETMLKEQRQTVTKLRDDYRTLAQGKSRGRDRNEIHPVFMHPGQRQASEDEYKTAQFAAKLNESLSKVMKIGKKKSVLNDFQKTCLAQLKDYHKTISKFSAAFNDTSLSPAVQNGGEYGFYVIFSPVHSEPSIGFVPTDTSARLQRALWTRMLSVTFLSGTLVDLENYNENRRAAVVDNVKSRAEFNTVKSQNGLFDAYLLKHCIRQHAGWAYKPHFTWEKVRVHLYDESVIPAFCQGSEEEDFDTAATRARLKDRIAEAVAEQIVDLVGIKGTRVLSDGSKSRKGGAMCLLPAYEDNEYLAKYLAGYLENMKKSNMKVRDLIVQERAKRSLGSLVAEFKKTPVNHILLSVSGWEGVDLPGEELETLFLIRIPHTSPDDPVYKFISSRSKASKYVERNTEEFWRFRQGLGRLLRTENDAGDIHIMDSRLLKASDPVHKKYRSFLESEFPGQIVKHMSDIALNSAAATGGGR